MKIFLDICHPADIHFFRTIIQRLEKKGHVFSITARERAYVFELLNHYNFPFVSRGEGKNGLFGKFFYMLRTFFFLAKKIKNFKPDIAISFSSPYLCQAAWLSGVKSICISDTDAGKLHSLFTFPFATCIVTPECYRHQHGKKHIRFNGLKELSYLKTGISSTREDVQRFLGISGNECYSIIRLVSFNAAHDFRKQGLDEATIRDMVNRFLVFGKVFIFSDRDLPTDLASFQIRLPVGLLHAILAGSSMMFSESSTMAAEAAVVGTPVVYCHPNAWGYLRMLAKNYEILFIYSSGAKGVVAAVEKAGAILKENNKLKYKAISEKIISDHIDVQKYFAHLIEDFHESMQRGK